MTDETEPREPFAYLHRNPRGAGLAKPSWALTLAAVLLAVAAYVVLQAVVGGVPAGLAVFIVIIFGGCGGFLGWIAIARLRWKYAYRHRYGHFPNLWT